MMRTKAEIKNYQGYDIVQEDNWGMILERPQTREAIHYIINNAAYLPKD